MARPDYIGLSSHPTPCGTQLDGEMWRYRIPGFEALLLAELQRQQQHYSHSCDTVLKTEGVSLPVHSCVISALSPQLSAALTSRPPAGTGGAHLLEFGALGAGTLLQVVGLLYSGEMAGEGEDARQRAVSAATELGIRGLVEVMVGGAEAPKDAGVQTDAPPPPPPPRQDRGRPRGMTQDDAPSLWGETPGGHGDVRTQAGCVDRGGASPAAQQSVDLAGIPYVPITLLTHPAEGHPSSAHHPPSYLMPPGEGPAPVFVLPLSYPTPLGEAPPTHAAELQGSWAGWAEAPPGDGEIFEHFEGNIPGFISHFLNPGQAKPPRGRGCRGQRRGGGGGGGGGGGRPRRAVTGERRARRARAAGRGRGATQPAAAVEMGLPAPPKSGLRRSWGTHISRVGQGGGAVGGMWFLSTRQQMKLCLKRKGKNKVWEDSNMDAQKTPRKKRCTAKRGGTKRTAKQDAEESVPASLSGQSDPPFTPDHPPYVSHPAPFLFHTTALPGSSAMHDDQPDQFDSLLEQFMMGMDIQQNNNNNNNNNGNTNNNTTSSHPPPPASTASASAAGSHPSSGVGVAAQGECRRGLAGCGACSSLAGPAQYEMPAPQQQPLGEGELHDILDHLLRSFELQAANCDADSGSRTQSTGQALAMENGSTVKTPIQTSMTVHGPKAKRGPGRPRKHSAHCKPGARTPRLPPRLTSHAGSPRLSPASASTDHHEGRVLRQRLKRERSCPSAGSSSKPHRGKTLAKSPLVRETAGVELYSRLCSSAAVTAPALKLKVPNSNMRTDKPFREGKAMHRLLSAQRLARVKRPGDLAAGVKGEKVAEKLRLVPVVSLRRSCPLLESYLEGYRGHNRDVKQAMAPIQGTHLGQLPPSGGQFTSTLPRLEKEEAGSMGSDASLAATTTNHPQAMESCDGDGRLETRSEGQHQDLHETLPVEESRPSQRQGEKRHIEHQEQIIQAKRVCLDQEGPTTPELGAPNSDHVSCLSEEEEARVTVETEDIIDVVAVNLPQGHRNHDGHSREPPCEVEEDILEEEARAGGRQVAAIIQVKATGTDQEVRSRVASKVGDEDELDCEEINVDRDGAHEDQGTPTAHCLPLHQKSTGKEAMVATSTHFFTEAAPLHMGSEVNLGSTGSWEQEEDEEVDVVGGCSNPIPPPVVRLAQMLKPAQHEEEDDDDVDVMGGEVACSPSLGLSPCPNQPLKSGI
ncbi:unnamed protein product [Merluccius merluccius]